MCQIVARHYVCPEPSNDPKKRQTHIVRQKTPCSNPKRCIGCGFGYYQELYDYPCSNCFTGNGWYDDYEQNILSYIEGLYGYLFMVLLGGVSSEAIRSVSTELLKTFYGEIQCRELAHKSRESFEWECPCFSSKNAWRSNLAIGLRRYWAYSKYSLYQDLFTEEQLQAVQSTMSDEFADAPTDEGYQWQWEVTPASLDQTLSGRYKAAMTLVRAFGLAPERADYFGKILGMSDEDVQFSLRVRGDALKIVALTLAADSAVPEDALRDIMRGFLPLLYPSGAFGNDLFDFRYDPLEIPGQGRAPRALGPIETPEGWKLMNDLLEVYIEQRKPDDPRRHDNITQVVLKSKTIITNYHNTLTRQDTVDLKTYRIVADYIEKHLEFVPDSESCTKELCGICRTQPIGGTMQDDHQEGIYPKVRSHRAVRWKVCHAGHAFGMACFLRMFLWRSNGQFQYQTLPWLCPYCRQKAV